MYNGALTSAHREYISKCLTDKFVRVKTSHSDQEDEKTKGKVWNINWGRYGTDQIYLASLVIGHEPDEYPPSEIISAVNKTGGITRILYGNRILFRNNTVGQKIIGKEKRALERLAQEGEWNFKNLERLRLSGC